MGKAQQYMHTSHLLYYVMLYVHYMQSIYMHVNIKCNHSWINSSIHALKSSSHSEYLYFTMIMYPHKECCVPVSAPVITFQFEDISLRRTFLIIIWLAGFKYKPVHWVSYNYTHTASSVSLISHSPAWPSWVSLIGTAESWSRNWDPDLSKVPSRYHSCSASK